MINKKNEIFELLELFNESQLKPRMLNKFQLENNYTFEVKDTYINKRLDFNDYSGKYYPNIDVIYDGYMGLGEKQVKEYVVSQAYDFFDDIIVMLTANVNLIHMKSLQNMIDAHLGQ